MLRDQLLSRVRILVTPWTVGHRAPLSIGFPKQEYWSGLSFPPPGDLPDTGIKPEFLASLPLEGRFFPLCHKVTLYSLWLTSNLRGWYSETSECFLFLHQFILWFQHPLLIQGVQITVWLSPLCMALYGHSGHLNWYGSQMQSEKETGFAFK